MYSREKARQDLSSINWSDGKSIQIASAPYRLEIMLKCSPHGRQLAAFSGGHEGRFFCYVQIVNSDRSWTGEGSIVVPVLPNGQLLMVVEQRPAQAAFGPRTDLMRLQSGDMPLTYFGPFSSIEFPGGGIERDIHPAANVLRELSEETGVSRVLALYRRAHPIYPFISDIAVRDYLFVAYLESMDYSTWAASDGGLHVLAVWPQEVTQNIRSGAIASGHAAILPFEFFKELDGARRSGSLDDLIDSGYIVSEQSSAVAGE